MLGNVERFEIVVRRFNFGAFHDGEADGEEDIFDFLENLADEMVRADGTNDAGEGKVDFLVGGNRFGRGFLGGNTEGLQVGFDMTL